MILVVRDDDVLFGDQDVGDCVLGDLAEEVLVVGDADDGSGEYVDADVDEEAIAEHEAECGVVPPLTVDDRMLVQVVFQFPDGVLQAMGTFIVQDEFGATQFRVVALGGEVAGGGWVGWGLLFVVEPGRGGDKTRIRGGESGDISGPLT